MNNEPPGTPEPPKSAAWHWHDKFREAEARVAELEGLLDLSDSPGSIVLLGMERNRLEARVEDLDLLLHEIAEVWAGSECGEPMTAQEAYAISVAKRMYAIAVRALVPNTTRETQ